MFNFMQGIDPYLLTGIPDMSQFQFSTQPIQNPDMSQAFGLLSMPTLDQAQLMNMGGLLFNGNPREDEKKMQGFPFTPTSTSTPSTQARSSAPGGGIGRMGQIPNPMFLPMANLLRR